MTRSADVDIRDYTAVFTLALSVDATEEEWAEQLAAMQEGFDFQWGQTGQEEFSWTVTINADDEVHTIGGGG